MRPPSFHEFAPLAESGEYDSSDFGENVLHWVRDLDKPAGPLPPRTLESLLLHLSMFPEAVETAKPLLDWCIQAGQTPWKASENYSEQTVYEVLVGWVNGGRNLAVLDWCWEQPGAPPTKEATGPLQVRSDVLSNLLRQSWGVGQDPLGALRKHGLDAQETWADGKTTLERVIDRWVSDAANLLKEHEQLIMMRNCRRLIKAARQEGIPEALVFRVATAGIHGMSTRFDRFSTFPADSKNSLRGSFKKLIEDFSPTKAASIQGGVDVLLDHYGSTPCRSVWEASAPLTLLLALDETKLLPAQNLERAVSMARRGLEQLPVEDVLQTPWECHQKAFRALQKFRFGELSLALDDPWDFALVSLFSNPFGPGRPPNDTYLRPAGLDPNDWPDVPFWNRIVKECAWSEEVRTVARGRELSHAWVGPHPEPKKRSVRF